MEEPAPAAALGQAAAGGGAEAEDPPPPGVHWLLRTAAGFRCRRCDKAVEAPRFAALAYSRCRPGPAPTWRRVLHAVQAGPGSVACTRRGP